MHDVAGGRAVQEQTDGVADLVNDGATHARLHLAWRVHRGRQHRELEVEWSREAAGAVDRGHVRYPVASAQRSRRVRGSVWWDAVAPYHDDVCSQGVARERARKLVVQKQAGPGGEGPLHEEGEIAL